MNIANLLKSYLDKRGLRPKSYSTYLTKIEAFGLFCRKEKIYRLSRCNRTIANKFLLHLPVKSNTTRNAYKNTLYSFFQDLVKDKKIKVNPFAETRTLPETRKGKMFFQSEQVKQLMNIISLECPELWIGCQLLYYCFIRNTELAALPLSDVLVKEGVILLHGQYSKNKKTIPVLIPDELLTTVKLWHDKQVAAGAKYFITVNNRKVSRGDWFYKKHLKFQKRLGIDNRYSFYSWKHTGAVNFYLATKDIRALQQQLRHHSLDQVAEYLRELGFIHNPTMKGHSMWQAIGKAA